MNLVRFLFRTTLLLWGAAILFALLGHFLEVEAFLSLSLAFRRFAPAVTLVWLLIAFGRMVWVRYWPFQWPKNGRRVGQTRRRPAVRQTKP